MSLIERAIERLSPSWAHRREMHRQMLGQLRGYDMGKMGRLTEGWNPSGSGPNAALEGASRLMVRRGRDQVRNNPWASIAHRRLPAAIVGTQVTASVTLESSRLRKAVAEDWDWLREYGNAEGDVSWDSDLARMVRTAIEVGDCIIAWEFLPASAGARVPLTWRALPPEYLDTSRLLGSREGHFVQSGVELDEAGRVHGYWLYDRHPQDTVLARTPTSRLHPAKMVDLLHEPLWIGQRRGVPWLGPVAIAMDDLAQYEAAALWKARMAAAFGLVKTETGIASTPVSNSSARRGDGSVTERMGPGMIYRVKAGESISSLTPPQDDNFEMFWKTRLMAIAAGLGLPAHAISGDLSSANYSSLREGKLLFHELVDGWQWHMVHDQLLRRAWRRFGLARFAAGRTAGGVLPPVKWAFPKRPWVDPKKDIEALEMELDLGLATYPDAVASRGEDPETQLAEIMVWKERLEAAGMPLGRTAAAAAAAAKRNAAPAVPEDQT